MIHHCTQNKGQLILREMGQIRELYEFSSLSFLRSDAKQGIFRTSKWYKWLFFTVKASNQRKITYLAKVWAIFDCFLVKLAEIFFFSKFRVKWGNVGSSLIYHFRDFESNKEKFPYFDFPYLKYRLYLQKFAIRYLWSFSERIFSETFSRKVFFSEKNEN